MAQVIGFDGRMADHPGIGRYIREFLQALSEMAHPEIRLFISRSAFQVQWANSLSLPACKTRASIYSLSEQCEMFARARALRSEEHTSELQSQFHLVCRLLLEKK